MEVDDHDTFTGAKRLGRRHHPHPATTSPAEDTPSAAKEGIYLVAELDRVLKEEAVTGVRVDAQPRVGKALGQ
jgi:hypothetical protein